MQVLVEAVAMSAFEDVVVSVVDVVVVVVIQLGRLRVGSLTWLAEFVDLWFALLVLLLSQAGKLLLLHPREDIETS